MPDHESPLANRSWLTVAGWLILLACVLLPFTSITVSSFWLDELYSVYFSNPDVDVSGALYRAAEDVHPPLYSLFLYLLRSILDWPVEVVGRGSSAILMMLSLAVVYASLRNRISRPAIVLTLLAAAMSSAYMGISLEMRSYALCTLIVSSVLFVTFRLVEEHELIPIRQIIALTFLLILGVLTHHYIVMIAASVLFYLLLTSISIRQTLIYILLGILVLSVTIASIVWQSPLIVLEPDKTWFKATLPFMLSEFIGGLPRLAGSILALAGFFLAGLAMIGINFSAIRSTKLIDVVRHPFVACLIISFLTLTLLVVFSFLVQPVFSRRVFNVLVPMFWIATGYAFHWGLTTNSKVLVWGVVAPALLASAARLPLYEYPRKTEYRNSAAHVKASGCEGDRLPVLMADDPSIRGDEIASFYGYYLKGSPGPQLKAVSMSMSDEAKARAIVRILGGPTKIRSRECRLVLWGVHNIVSSNARSLATEIERSAGFSAGSMRVVAFPNFGNGYFLGVLLGRPKFEMETDSIVIEYAPAPSG